MATRKPEAENLPVAIEEYAILKQSPEDLRDIIADNLGSGTIGPFDLERVHVPTGGGTRWERASFESGEETQVESIEGIIVCFRDVRVWWKNAFGEGEGGAGSPPDCSSQDSIHGDGLYAKESVGNPTGLCASCPNSQWGSDRRGGRGQDCGQNRLLFMVEKDSLLPMNLKVPPSSFQDARKYAIGLAAKGIPIWSVLTRLTLHKDKNDSGIAYSRIRFSYSKLPNEIKEKLRSVHQAMQKTLGTARIDVSDVRPQEAEKPEEEV